MIRGGGVAFQTNTLALVPYMGWDSWITDGASVSQTNVKAAADALVSTGLAAAGYKFVITDEGWATGSRDGSGQPLWNTSTFASGMASLATYIHSKGLLAGIYSDSGSGGGCGALWSYGFFQNDFTWFFNNWGFDFAKMDTGGYHNPGCGTGAYNNGLDPKTVTGMLATAWKDTVLKPTVLEGPTDYMANNQSWEFSPYSTTSWYVTTDGPAGPVCSTTWSDVLFKFNEAMWHPGAVGPHSFPHPDMLFTSAPGLNSAQEKAQFALWSILSAPLVLGCDPAGLSAGEITFLTNAGIIAIDQDTLVSPALFVGGPPSGDQTSGTAVIYKKLSVAGTRAVALFNMGGSPASVSVANTDVGLSGTFTATDLFTGSVVATGVTSYTNASVPATGVQLLKITAGTENPVTTSYQVNAGPGGATGAWITNTNTHDGTSQSVVHAIDTSGVTSPAPTLIYEGSRVGEVLTTCYGPPGCTGSPNLQYYIPNLQIGHTYTVRLHFSENWKTGAGQRVFDVSINNQFVLRNLDVYATAGAQYKAVVQQFSVLVVNGLISINFVLGSADYPMISGIEVIY